MDNVPRAGQVCQHVEMRLPQPLPDPLKSAPFTWQEALDAGVSRQRWRHRALGAPSRGIRSPSTGKLELPQIVRPYTVVTAFSAASHSTAFLLWEFPGFLPGSHESTIHLSRPDTMAIPRRKGVKGHVGQFFDDEITNLNGLLITTRPRTWLDCARRMTIDEITVVADHLLRRPRAAFEGRSEPFCTREELEEMLDRHKGTPGIRKARLALDQARIGADSAPETRLRLALERAGLPEPELNRPTELGSGVVREPDLGFREQRVAVEYEGEGHSEPAQIVRDIEREEDYSRAGWRLVRISKRHMGIDAHRAVSKVRNALIGQGWTPK